jgi:mRNA-degrading endonuclease RelE of RelBE toxin-antitoxin system
VNVKYKKTFLKDLHKLKGSEIYEHAVQLSFEILPRYENLHAVPNFKPLKNHRGRARIRLGQYRIGINIVADGIELVRILHRREIYRYFPVK